MASQVKPTPQYQSTPAEPKRGRKGLPHQSKKRKALMREVGPQRAARKAEVGCCMICRKPFAPADLDGDEIARGAAREECLKHPELTLISCRRCHDKSQDWPIAKRIAAVVRFDIEQTCLTYCELTGTAPTHVQADDVIIYLTFRKFPKVPKPKGKRHGKEESRSQETEAIRTQAGCEHHDR